MDDDTQLLTPQQVAEYPGNPSKNRSPLVTIRETYRYKNILPGLGGYPGQH